MQLYSREKWRVFGHQTIPLEAGDKPRKRFITLQRSRRITIQLQFLHFREQQLAQEERSETKELLEEVPLPRLDFADSGSPIYSFPTIRNPGKLILASPH